MRSGSSVAPVALLLFMTACSNAGAGGGGQHDAASNADSASSRAGAPASAAAPADPAAPPGTAARRVTHTLASGTAIELTANDSVNSRHGQVGDTVTATSTRAVSDPGGAVMIPAGTIFKGTVVAIAPAERPGLEGTLRLAFTSARIGGTWRPVPVRVVSLATQMHGRGVTTGDAVKVGAGTAVGAVAGRVIGGNATGTVIGAAAGTAAGAVYANQTRDIDIILPRGAAISVALTEPLSTTSTVAATR